MKTLLEKHNPQRWARWQKLMAQGETAEIGSTPREAVYQRDRMILYRYKRETPATYKTPVLLVYSLINRPSVMDLLPGRSVVGSLLEAGYEVYLLDWGIPDALDQFTGLDEYVNLLLRTAVRQTCLHSERPKVSLLGYCMGGTLAAMYTALHPERVENLLLLGTPLHFRSAQLLYKWGTDPKMFRPDSIVEGWGMAPPWAFDGYTLLTIESKLRRLASLYDNLDDQEFLDSYIAMEQWVNDNIPMAGSAFVEFCQGCFHENKLIEGRLEVGGRTVDLSSIKCPVLIIAGTSDHLVPPETTAAEKGPFPNQEAILFPSGHIGLSVSRSSHKKLWPQVTAWLGPKS